MPDDVSRRREHGHAVGGRSAVNHLNEWIDCSVGGLLVQRATADPHGVAVQWLVDGDLASFSWAEVAALANAGARRLRASHNPLGAVALWAPNSVAWYLAMWSAALSGRPLVPLNPNLTLAEAVVAIADSAVSTVLTVEDFRGRPLRTLIKSEWGDGGASEVWNIDAWPAVEGTALQCVDRAGTDESSECVEPVDPAQPFVIQYTSGTTGAPKGAVLSHSACVNAARTLAAGVNPTRHEIWCSPMPLHHVGGLIAFALAPAAVAGTFVLVEDFTAESFHRCALLSRATLLGGVPTLYLRMLDHPSLAARPLPHLRTVIIGGASIPSELVRRVEERFDASAIVFYGQSEAPAITQTALEDTSATKATTIGRPLPLREVRLVDPVTGSDAKPGEVGEIWVRTRIRMNGYLNRPEATAETIDPNGWLHTGDIAAANPDETLQFRGRLKDMILRGGENIYASEVEAAIDSLSGVAQVAVVGLPDDRWGEIVAAMVVPERGVELSPQLLDAAVANQLAPFKRPVIWKFVESLPLTASGKPQKFKIVESMTPLGNGKAE